MKYQKQKYDNYNKINKITDLNSLKLKLSKLKKNNKKVVLCHGVFDILHLGHIEYFKEAKNYGHILVVSITENKFVNKGNNRPIFDTQQRALYLNSIEIIDYIVINNYPTAVNLIKKIRPDFYIKGPEYKNIDEDKTKGIIEEKKAIIEINGKIKFTTGKKYSSTNILNTVNNNLNDEQYKFINLIKQKYKINNLENYINKLKTKKVLVLGETIVDTYISCEAIGKSGKEPILTYRYDKTEKFAGGTIAVANQIAEFTDNVDLVSDIGEYKNQFQFLKKNINKKIKWNYFVKKDSPTIEKIRYIDEYTENKIIGVYDINDNIIKKELSDSIIRFLKNKINKYDIVIIVDYGHGFITEDIVNFLNINTKCLAVNTQINSFNIGYNSISKYKKCDYVCIHENELRLEMKDRKTSIEKLILKLKKKIKSKIYTITQGKNGARAFTKNESIHCPAFTSNVVDRIGSGDTLIALSSLGYAGKFPIEFLILFGSLGAANTVSKRGTGKSFTKKNLFEKLYEFYNSY